METWKRTVYISLICVFCTSFGVSQLAPILPLYFHDLGVQRPSAMSLWSGLATGATYLVVCLVAPFWGRVADKKGRKITLIRSSFGMALCNLLLAFQTTPEGVVIIRLIQGLVSGFYSATITLIASESPIERTGWALGLLASANLAGSLIGPLLGGYIADTIGIRNDFILVGILMGLAGLLATIFIHENYVPKPNIEKLSFRKLKEQIPEFNSIVALCIASFIYAICIMSLQPVISVYIKGIVPSNTENLAFIAGAVFSAMGIAQLISSSPLGKLVDKIGPRKVLVVSLIYVGLFNIPQAYVTDVYQLALIRFLQGFGLGGMLPALNTYLSSKTPREFTGQVFSYNQSSLFLGYFLGAVGGASLMAWLGFTTLFWVSGGLFIISALWIGLKLK
ncbi:MAG: MFS transporter [Veillonella sp.]|uniref:MFS transporter n=1 Tax=Veillonella TaxID=29465 RepID=UPI00290B2284|nr:MULTISPECIES: MFS transporter [Veillonella]MDU5166080.1 MFS transporter [Veillonella parvula]MDU5558953.1 MFS transporter [Veillonella parvula]MDU7279547.1 MFS transporter [Veillonella parvula]MDU7911433.1 MFS transporter [Veillonella parvula]MDU7928628.1 MFS transporter [Veillonella sp.]